MVVLKIFQSLSLLHNIMSYPKNMKINDCGIKYVNGIYRKQINKKTKTHCYIKFTKITNEDAKDDEKQNTDKKIKIQVIQDCKTGEFSIETSDNIQLYKATSGGKWSIVNGQRPIPQFLPYYVITQFFPLFQNSNNKKSKRNKKKNKNPNNYNNNNDNNNFIHPSFKLCQHYKPDSRVVGGFVLFYKDVFSQWFTSKMIIDNISYANCEQYMMAEKAKLFNDNEYYDLILKTDDPRKCKKLGRGVRNFKESIWKQYRQ
eukprot:390815_1